MGGVFGFFCKNVARVDDSSYVDDGGVAVSNNLADVGLVKVDVLDSFVCHGGLPGDGGFIVAGDDRGVGCFRHAKVGGTMLEVEKFKEALFDGHDLGFTGTLCGPVLAD